MTFLKEQSKSHFYLEEGSSMAIRNVHTILSNNVNAYRIQIKLVMQQK
jgi:hypothetical protein